MDCNQIPAKVKSLIGQGFGRLEVIAYAGKDERGRSRWICRCNGADCGGKQVAVRSDNLRSGDVASCGCLGRENAAERARAMGFEHGLYNHPLRNVWRSMIARCTDPRRPEYPDYGGRGITVCAEWLGYGPGLAQFVADMNLGYEPGLELDRRNNDGPYSPENCRWVTRTQNSRNKRSNRVIEYAGQRRCLAEWVELLGLSRSTLRNRLNRGWPVARALTEGVAPDRLTELGLTE
jgi:hypothetical protein